MPRKGTLFGVLGDFRLAWPRGVFTRGAGVEVSSADPSAWLASINDAVCLTDVTTASDADKVVTQARFHIDLVALSLESLPFGFITMPDVEFRILSLELEKAGYLYVSQSDADLDILIEGLPVEIQLPPGLLSLHPADYEEFAFEKKAGKFTAGKLDSQEVILKRDSFSSIRTHLRVQVTSDQQVWLSTAVPMSFGRCRLMDLPAIAVHDFRLMPYPGIAQEHEEWLRHGVGSWLGEAESIFSGCFAFRGLELDPKQPPISDLAEWVSGHAAQNDLAHFTLEDLVVPFVSPWVLPIPRHITAGIRRDIENPLSAESVFNFEQAPIQFTVNEDPQLGIIIEKLFYSSQPLQALTERLDLGLELSAALVFGDIEEANNAISFGLAENLTLRLGYRREVDVNTGVLAEDGTEFNALKFTILGTKIEIMGISAGYSIGRAVGENAGFLDSAELFGDLFVSSEPQGSEDAIFKLRSLNNEPLRLVMEGLGWRQGHFSFDGFNVPDGVVAMFGPVGVVIEELGVSGEDGGSYLSFSGGLLVTPPSGIEGGLLFKRLRFRIAGSDSAPPFKLDGLFGFFKAPTVRIEVGGYYTDVTIENTQRQEFGFTGTVALDLKAARYGFGVDLISGKITAPNDEFRYFLIQAFFEGLIPIYSVELRGLRFLFAKDMQPKLSDIDRSAAQLRYYSCLLYTSPSPRDS